MLSIFNVRSYLLNYARRTINRSQCLLTHSFHLQLVYYIAVLFSAWTQVFPVHTVQKDYPSAITTFLSTVNTEGVFLVNLAFVGVFAVIMLVLGFIADTTYMLVGYYFK